MEMVRVSNMRQEKVEVMSFFCTVLFGVWHFWVPRTEIYKQHSVVLKFSLFCLLCNF